MCETRVDRKAREGSFDILKHEQLNFEGRKSCTLKSMKCASEEYALPSHGRNKEEMRRNPFDPYCEDSRVSELIFLADYVQ